MAIENSIIFGGVNSADFGIYISGEGVFNAPKRDVEMITIPGRNGAFALDNGRFENIEVTYPAFNFEPNDYDTFAQRLSDFRNAICAQRGYQRLEDTFHPDEYRMAAYIGGLDIKPIKYNTASEFDIVFDCKPQRWLKDGETAVTIGEWGETETVSGDIVSVDNPNGILAVKSLEVDLEPIQSGSGTPSPTNIRPISGHDSVDTNKTGINVWDEEWQNGYLGNSGSVISDANSVCSKNYIPIKQSATYYAVCPSGKSLRICAYKEDETFISLQSVANRTFTLPSGTAYIKWSCYGYGTTYNNDISINYPSTDTEYHAYQGTTYTTALGRTVYGGNLEQISGLLTDNMAIYQIGANTNFSAVQTSQAAGNWVEVLSVTNARTADTEVLTVSECCKSVSNNNRAVDVNDYRCYAANGHLYLRAPAGANVTTKEDFHSIFDGYNIVYELATPQTYQLTAQQIDLLLGDNNIWSDSGDIALEYGQNPSVLFNPTLFESSPLLETAGSGSIQFNGYEIDFEGVPIGEVQIAEKESWTIEDSAEFTFDTTLLNTGDPIYPEAREFEVRPSLESAVGWFIDEGVQNSTNVLDAYAHASNKASPKRFIMYLIPDLGDGFVYGTAKTITCSARFNYQYGLTPTTTSYWNETVQVTIAYGGADSYTVTVQSSGNKSSNVTRRDIQGLTTPTMYGDSSKPNNNPIFIDCDLGEAYTNEGGVYRSLNQYIDLGSELPKLASGSNTVTFDNTITELKVTPRWWKV